MIEIQLSVDDGRGPTTKSWPTIPRVGEKLTSFDPEGQFEVIEVSYDDQPGDLFIARVVLKELHEPVEPDIRIL